MSPRADTFFEVIIASFLARRPLGARVDGDVAFTVLGFGTWTIAMRKNAACSVLRGLPSTGPDAHLELDGEAFQALVRGSIDLTSALRSGRASFSGSHDVFTALAGLLGMPSVLPVDQALAPPRSGVALRQLLTNRHGPINKGEKP